MKDVDFDKCNLSAARFRGATITRARFRGAILKSADLDVSEMRECDLSDADLTEAAISGLIWDSCFDRAHMRRAMLVKADASRCTFDDALLAASNAKRVHLSRCSLRGADLSGVNFHSALLIGVDLRKAKFEGALLRHAAFSGARVCGVVGRPAEIMDCKMTGLDFSEAGDGSDIRGEAELFPDVQRSGESEEED